MVVPLRIGGGSRLKILEALATNTPVVSTRVGAEGLELEPGRHLTVVEDVDDLPSAIIRAVREPAAAQAQAECGREAVLRRYGWDALADQMERVWIDCVTGGHRGVASGWFGGEATGMNIVHLTASTFYGGPERQILGLAHALPEDRTTVLSFAEGGRCRAFLTEARRQGVEAAALEHDTPRFRRRRERPDAAAASSGRRTCCCVTATRPTSSGRLAARRAAAGRRRVARLDGRELARPAVRGHRPRSPALDGSRGLRVGGPGGEGAAGGGRAGARCG